MSNIPFQAIDWTTIEKVLVKGEKGIAHWQTIQLPGLRIRLVEYSSDFLVDHWCQKGHIIHCLAGSFVTELATGEKITLKTNDSFVVSDDASSHLTYSEKGARLLIIDGDFLKPNE
jgi:hypothetical protein